MFAGLGLVLCFVGHRRRPGGAVAAQLAERPARRRGRGLLRLSRRRVGSLGQRAAAYTRLDLAVGSVGMLLVLRPRRSVGWSLPALAIVFLLYAHQSVARGLPDWLFPHRGQDWGAIVGQTWLRSEGIFGTAMAVMFRYVFLFVLSAWPSRRPGRPAG